jgi:hypothetical protein
MQEILESITLLDTKDLILLGLGGVLGYLLSLIAAKQTEKKKDLVLEVLGRQIVAEATEYCPFRIVDLAGEPLDNVYFIVVRVWNRGREAVRGDEISPSAPITIDLGEDIKVIGPPRVTKPHQAMDFSINSVDQNRYQIGFDCLNQDEWVQIGFYTAGNPRAVIKGTGRVFGQHSDFAITTDDSKATIYERLTALIAFAMIVSSPFCLFFALWWIYEDYTLAEVFHQPDKLPKTLSAMLYLGILIPVISAFYFFSLWLKRKRNPKGYPIREDFEPTQSQSLKAFYLTALHGKRYEVSTSVHDYGEITVRSAPSKDP